MNHDDADPLRAAWHETDQIDLVSGLDARLAGAIRSRARRRRATLASATMLVIAVALLAPGDETPSVEASGELLARGDTPSGDTPSGDALSGDAPSGDAPSGDALTEEPAGVRPGTPMAAQEPAVAALNLAPVQQDATVTADEDATIVTQSTAATVLAAQGSTQTPGASRRAMRTLPRLPMAPANRAALATRMAAQRAALRPSRVGTLPRSPRRPVRQSTGDGTPLDARAPLDASTEGVHA